MAFSAALVGHLGRDDDADDLILGARYVEVLVYARRHGRSAVVALLAAERKQEEELDRLVVVAHRLVHRRRHDHARELRVLLAERHRVVEQRVDNLLVGLDRCAAAQNNARLGRVAGRQQHERDVAALHEGRVTQQGPVDVRQRGTRRHTRADLARHASVQKVTKERLNHRRRLLGRLCRRRVHTAEHFVAHCADAYLAVPAQLDRRRRRRRRRQRWQRCWYGRDACLSKGTREKRARTDSGCECFSRRGSGAAGSGGSERLLLMCCCCCYRRCRKWRWRLRDEPLDRGRLKRELRGGGCWRCCCCCSCCCC